ncbi:hypothetical protein KIPB_000890 [Kipferlia bialata]|uniref:Uncharacterized protein n=1 Tax=Kipferlia bialata TaxID=797122 RepID=A0A9K3GEV7_9EUKA|nr:hypothetical protein KIPB_000890 [Kipferlia bialata]|eukprot:g890.t1
MADPVTLDSQNDTDTEYPPVISEDTLRSMSDVQRRVYMIKIREALDREPGVLVYRYIDLIGLDARLRLGERREIT